MSGVVRTVSFTVPRKAVSVNQAYARAQFMRSRGAGGGKGLILTKAGRDYKEACKAHAMVAARLADWPQPERVKQVKIQIVAFNSRHDADAPIKLTCDALEGVVYVKDKAVGSVLASKGKDDGSARVEVTVELLEAA